VRVDLNWSALWKRPNGFPSNLALISHLRHPRGSHRMRKDVSLARFSSGWNPVTDFEQVWRRARADGLSPAVGCRHLRTRNLQKRALARAVFLPIMPMTSARRDGKTQSSSTPRTDRVCPSDGLRRSWRTDRAGPGSRVRHLALDRLPANEDTARSPPAVYDLLHLVDCRLGPVT
jgi:hypothetical protein